ncbi:MAG TPA: glycosyltransferase, partial [Acidimicrobiales bacterium]
MTAPLRVEVVVPVGGMGGAEAMALSVLDHQAHRLDVRVLGLGESPFLDAARERGLPVAVVPTGRRAGDVARAAAVLARRWRRSDVEVVWANGVKPAAAAVPAGLLTGVPVVWAKHDFSYDARLARPLAAGSAAVVAVSELVAEATRRRDVVVLPPPRPAVPAPTPRLVPEAALVAAVVGRLARYKGVDDAIVGLPEPWHLAIIGDDDPTGPGHRDELAALARAAGVADRVHFLGSVPDAARLLPGVDAVLVVTKPDARGLGREGWSMVA